MNERGKITTSSMLIITPNRETVSSDHIYRCCYQMNMHEGTIKINDQDYFVDVYCIRIVIISNQCTNQLPYNWNNNIHFYHHIMRLHRIRLLSILLALLKRCSQLLSRCTRLHYRLCIKILLLLFTLVIHNAYKKVLLLCCCCFFVFFFLIYFCVASLD